MNNSWKEEARGIPPWAGAHVHHCLLGDDRTDIVTWFVDKPGFENWRVESYLTGFHLDIFGGSWADVPMVLALDNPDTCSAFVRRLALRLGCPEEVAEEGVIAGVGVVVIPASRRSDGKEYRSERLYLTAGRVEFEDYIDTEAAWSESVEVNTGDRLLALVRAWRSGAMVGGE